MKVPPKISDRMNDETYLQLGKHSSIVTTWTHFLVFQKPYKHLQSSSQSYCTTLRCTNTAYKMFTTRCVHCVNIFKVYCIDIQDSYRSHRDTHVGSLFGLKQTPGHRGKMPVHCLSGTEKEKSSQFNI